MKSLKGRKLADSVSSVGSMILFLIFASCSLIIIAAGASTYARISDNVNNTFTAATAVKYVTNNGELVCVIMSDAEDIGERSGLAEAYIDYVGGDIIFRNAHLLVEETEDGMFRIAVMARDEWSESYCRVRDSGGDDTEGL